VRACVYVYVIACMCVVGGCVGGCVGGFVRVCVGKKECGTSKATPSDDLDEELQRVASVLQSVAVCCSLLQSVAVCCSVSQVCCSLLQYIAVCCSLLQSVAV